MPLRQRIIGASLIIPVAFCAPPLDAQRGGRGPDSSAIAAVRAKYRKLEVRIPIRDGVKLFTSVYIPRDTSRNYPLLMSRTPYGIGAPEPDVSRPSLGLGQSRPVESVAHRGAGPAVARRAAGAAALRFRARRRARR